MHTNIKLHIGYPDLNSDDGDIRGGGGGVCGVDWLLAYQVIPKAPNHIYY